jgi:hypothetical protein
MRFATPVVRKFKWDSVFGVQVQALVFGGQGSLQCSGFSVRERDRSEELGEKYRETEDGVTR